MVISSVHQLEFLLVVCINWSFVVCINWGLMLIMILWHFWVQEVKVFCWSRLCILYCSLQSLYDKWCKVLDAVPERDTSLETELQRQQQNENLRLQFAQIANEVGAYIEARSSALSELSMQGQGTMEEQLEAVKAFQAETMGYQPKLDEAEFANQVRERGTP